MRIHTSRLGFVLLAATMLSGIPGYCVQDAQAQSAAERQHQFNIPAQPVPQALNAIGRVAGISVVVNGGAASGARSQAVSGSLTTRQALSAALAGTGLTYSFTNANTVTVFDPSTGAQTGGYAADGETVQLETIEVAGANSRVASAELPYQTPGSSAYISAEEINRVPPSSQGDIFKSTPGVVSSGSRSGQGLNVNIRGLQGMNRVATLIDGTQQSTSSYIGYRGQTSSVFVDPDLIAGIDITKGPSDGPLGNGAMGGVVNMRTLNARDIVADGEEYGARLKGAIGTNTKAQPPVNTTVMRDDAPGFFNGDSFNGSVAAATVQDNFEFLTALTRRKTGNYFAGTKGNGLLADGVTPLSPVGRGQEVFNTSEDSFSLLLKSKVHLSEDASLELGYIYYDNDHGELDDFPYVYLFNPLTQRELSERKTHTLTSKFSYNPADNPLVDMNVSAWLADVKARSSTSASGNVDVLTYGAEAHNTSVFNTPIGDLKVNYGGQVSLEDSEGEEVYFFLPGNPTPWFLNAGPTGTRRLASVFSRADLQMTDWLRFGMGLRYDTYDIEQGPGVLAPFGDKSGERFNPSFSVTLEPWEGIQFYGQYVEGWRPPSLREANFILGTILYPNPALRPETAKNYEAGVNVLRSNVWADGDSVKFKASYFNNTYDDYIVRDSIAQNWTEPRHWANIPSASFEGFEISFKYDAERVFLEAGLTRYTEVEFCHQLTGCASKTLGIDYGSNYIPPDYLATLTGGVRLFDQKLTLGARATFIGERAVSESMGLGYVSSTLWPKSTVVDLFGSYEFNDTVSLNVSAENVTDRYYLDPLSLTRAPAPGRTVRAGLTAKF